MTDKTEKIAPLPSLRDTIRSAVDTEKERIVAEQPDAKEVKETKDEKKLDTEKPEDKAVQHVGEKVSDDAKRVAEKTEEKREDKTSEVKEVKEIKTEDKQPDVPKESKESKELKEFKKEVKAPFGVPKAVREKFSSLDTDTQDYITKVSKELQDVRTNEGRKTYLKDIDQVLEPYQEQMRRINASPAAVVKRLLEYTDALSNKQYQEAAILNLAKDFDIDLVKVVDDLVAQTQKASDPDVKQQTTHVPPEIIQRLDAIQAELSTVKTAKVTDNNKAAEETVNGWAGFDPVTNEYKTKPYFPHVRKAMYSLISSGTVPLVNGRIDLDGAYDAACFAHPEIREMIMEDQSKAKEAAIREQQQQQIAKAKNAGVSIKPGAPVSRGPIQQKKNSGPQPYVPAGDSIRAALAELRGGRA